MEINVKVSNQIASSPEEVFDAIVNPEKIIRYFVSNTSGPIIPNAKLHWEFKDYCVSLDVDVLEVIKDKHISFEWEASGKRSSVQISIDKKEEQLTQITITESPFSLIESDVKKALQQTQGWTDFICSLKAFLYTGINLRSGKYPSEIS
ncbi:SRPBCC domain-containing protein [Gillisia sp. M10.2A]|uniref:SRPBCC domain-containing protein n=1 Tax=Gillisia lutea TaxID=2909668 RepID=A0ABS9EI60_9FLAO|nr:SRPBCC domain-containing protein [Gillisia lutea]MCF4102527.1 SRPBCC domain-containing protein [Gillisia lutea]